MANQNDLIKCSYCGNEFPKGEHQGGMLSSNYPGYSRSVKKICPECEKKRGKVVLKIVGILLIVFLLWAVWYWFN